MTRNGSGSRFATPAPVSLTLNLAPMVDVMMCLIIFFLLASKLVSAQLRPLRLPQAHAEQVQQAAAGSQVVINVVPAGDDLVQYVVPIWDGRRITERVPEADELPGHLRLRAERARQAGQELRCVIRADRDVRYEDVEAVLRACGLAKIGKVSFRVQALEPEGRP